MALQSLDRELIADYATKGSDAAFRALVARHADLVYATALRQLGDPGLAQEVTQNVFIALARKSARLGAMETIAGWLYRCAIFESKTRMRSEMRRRQREEIAAALAAREREGESPIAALAPLLDEALLNLREGDRMALVLRFLEDRSLRDVGAVLGVDEDAARKRVSRALERVTEFFRQRGFAVAAAGVAMLLCDSAHAAPAAVVMSSANAGLACGGAASGLGLVLFHLMSLTKAQVAIMVALLIAAPATWQWHARTLAARSAQTIRVNQFRGQSDAAGTNGDPRFFGANKFGTGSFGTGSFGAMSLQSNPASSPPRAAGAPSNFISPVNSTNSYELKN